MGSPSQRNVLSLYQIFYAIQGKQSPEEKIALADTAGVRMIE